ncbi:MAG: hypothetical protein EB120_03475 [Proteobacteria bacterium]|nr:hypothetical protein [Pseudomonadota bacterium]
MVEIPLGGRAIIECSQLEAVAKSSDNQSVVFHLIPKTLYGQEECNMDRASIWSLLTAQDHYVEYYLPNGYAAGVLYQSGSFNYEQFSQERTTLIQAPKVYTSQNLSTYLMLINNGFDEGYQVTAVMDCVLVDSHGKTFAKWEETIAPFQVKLINLSEKKPLQLHSLENDLSFSTFYGLCRNATLLPLTITKNGESNDLAVEHSLPPNYYAGGFTGPVRKRGIIDLGRTQVFGN